MSFQFSSEQREALFIIDARHVPSATSKVRTSFGCKNLASEVVWPAGKLCPLPLAFPSRFWRAHTLAGKAEGYGVKKKKENECGCGEGIKDGGVNLFIIEIDRQRKY